MYMFKKGTGGRKPCACLPKKQKATESLVFAVVSFSELLNHQRFASFPNLSKIRKDLQQFVDTKINLDIMELIDVLYNDLHLI